MKTRLGLAVVSVLFGATAASFGAGNSLYSVGASYSVTYVGANPFTNWPSTGGTGGITAQPPGSATITKNFTALGDIPIIVDGGPSTGTDYLHINESVTNNTGVPWTDFHFVVTKIDANSALQVDFLNVVNSTGEFTSSQALPNVLSLFGNVPDGGTFNLAFDLQISSQAGAYNLFGIHEVPSVPEPATLALAGCSLFGVIRKRGRRLIA